MTTKKQRKNEITWNIVNSCLAGGLVFVGAALNGGITTIGIMSAVVAGLLVALTKFSEYWKGEQSEYCKCLGNFI